MGTACGADKLKVCQIYARDQENSSRNGHHEPRKLFSGIAH
jgi:tRNA-binding EMAP/Myf-like protein